VTTTTVEAAGTDLSGAPPSTGLALATDPASQRRPAPRAADPGGDHLGGYRGQLAARLRPRRSRG
jgi:hypothetical protein